MDDLPVPLGIATVVALLAGAATALQQSLPSVLIRLDLIELTSGSITIALFVAGVVGLALSPVGTFATGYVWGTRADVRSGYLTLAGLTGAAALVGFLAASVVMFAVMLPTLDRLLLNLLAMVTSAMGLLSIPLAALAGGAIAHFRTSERDGDRPTPSRTDDGVDRDPAIDRSEREAAFE